MVIVVNRRCDVSNAISSEISMGRKLAWVENCIGNYIHNDEICPFPWLDQKLYDNLTGTLKDQKYRKDYL